MIILRWPLGIKGKEMAKNEEIRIVKVGDIAEKMQEIRLRWLGHEVRRSDEYVSKKSADRKKEEG